MTYYDTKLFIIIFSKRVAHILKHAKAKTQIKKKKKKKCTYFE